MGLDVWVHCNCIKEGKAPPHPFPELLAFDEAGEAILKSQGEIGSELWLRHDKWHRNSCSHSGHLIEKRFGNIIRRTSSRCCLSAWFIAAHTPAIGSLLVTSHS